VLFWMDTESIVGSGSGSSHGVEVNLMEFSELI
jgi:hypothetical protein